jgi:hypothetical protein
VSYVSENWDKQLVTFDFSPQPAPPEVIIREVVREPEVREEQDTGPIHPPCPLGREFDEWCHDHVLLTPDMSLMDVKRDKLLVAEQFRVFTNQADSNCRNHTESNYYCIAHVFHEWMGRLEKKERGLMPSENLFFMPKETEDESPTKDMTLGESLDEAEEQNW